MGRRLARAKRARREAIKGSEEERLLKPPRKRKSKRLKKRSEAYPEHTLNKYL